VFLNFFNPGKFMKKTLLALALLAQAATFSIAAETDKEKKEDIAKHRSIAAAHENAAKCLESGKKEDVCNKELQAACKGLAIGKFCGMKHEH
jgi:uncharacterized protein YgiB involved in biofilm formation